jgi:DNA-binding Lrp family transcriptional regulator
MRPDRIAEFSPERVNRGGGLRVSLSEARRKRDAEPRLMPGNRYDALEVDDIDARIVAFLIRDARASYSLIGGEVGLSAPAVKRRVDRLRAAGAITGFSARVDPAAMGWTTEGYVELFCGGRTSPDEIGAAVRRYPEVVDACTVTGEADALVHIRATDVRHFEDVMERIRAEPFVVRTKSVIVLSRLVDRADALAPPR